MTAVYFQECHSLEARELKNTSKSWITYFSCVLPHMLPFFWSFCLSKPGESWTVHTLTKLFPTEADPQTLTWVLGLLTYRYTVPSVSPTNENQEQGLLLEALN